MNKIDFENCSFRFNDSFSLLDICWKLLPGEHWVILGSNGAGKSALASTLMGEGDLISGHFQGLTSSVEWVSFEKQSAIIDEERKKSGEGTLVSELLSSNNADSSFLARLLDTFTLSHLLKSPFLSLSTGESRKVLIIHALIKRPEIIILDEPFDGLDSASSKALMGMLDSMSQKTRMVMVLNRIDELPDFVNRALVLESGRIDQRFEINNQGDKLSLAHLMHFKFDDLVLPDADSATILPTLNPDDPLIRMKDILVAYGDKIILSDLNWEVKAQQHWQIIGPNGCGKTTLLNLITGDHPQCYKNDIFVFGYQRGQGETIWQIKQFIGYVSSALQWEYRVGTNLQNVLLSGFFDSIGLYSSATQEQINIAKQWLELLDMSHRWDQAFSQLSYGEQRLLLIARAMVKHPKVLILDEPCVGLDEMNRKLVLALISYICSYSSTSVIYVNHHSEDKIDEIDHILNLGA
ncbi:MAG: molybdate transport system ATP-binding protein [Candidatus Azotimanducaceae bacterium]